MPTPLISCAQNVENAAAWDQRCRDGNEADLLAAPDGTFTATLLVRDAAVDTPPTNRGYASLTIDTGLTIDIGIPRSSALWCIIVVMFRAVASPPVRLRPIAPE